MTSHTSLTRQADPVTETRFRPGTLQKVGLVLCGLNCLSNVPSVLTPTSDGGDGPPMGILVICAVLGVVGMVATVLAWRGSRAMLRLAAAAIIVCTLTSLPAFFVDVPMWLKGLVAVSVVWTVAAVVLMFSAPRPDAAAGA